ncbi:hypothetical protein [Mucilaginibacter sp. 3215]|uniref:hypothetical protein n=1 Tax=Mucilaginibacter sp. 3215 TaxID=3373912 RepID=UPI003D1BC917
MKKLLMTSILSVLILTNILRAQPNATVNACSACTEALKNGTYDEFKRETNYSLDESVNTLFSYDYEFWSHYSSSSSHNQSLDAAYSVYSLSFGNSGTEAQKKEEFNRQKSTYIYSRSLSQNAIENVSQRLINKTPYETFLACVRATCGTGLFFEQQSTGDNIIVTARWVITGGNPNQVSALRSMSIANASNVDFNFKTGVQIKPLNSISGLFKRIDPSQDVIISFDFENFPSQQILIKRGKNQNFNTPVGTIIISQLDYSTFCALSDIPSIGNNADLVWVPADGRNVSGSAYGKRIATVPDLRGVFLRGLNVFDPVNNPNPDPRQLDPETRTAGQLQTQAVQAHDHPITDPGHAHTYRKGGQTIDTWGSRPPATGQLNCDHCGDFLSTEKAPTGITKTDLSTGPETRPINKAVYYYIKIN